MNMLVLSIFYYIIIYMSNRNLGIPSSPVKFDSGLPLPAQPELSPAHSQNLWHSIEANQRWIAAYLLGMQTDAPYKEQPQLANIQTEIAAADARRLSDKNYAVNRNLGSLAAFLWVQEELVREEFRDKNVLDIGSGAGELSNDLRREANAWVTELDFSPAAFCNLPPIFNGRGKRILGDGRNLDLADGQFERTVSVFSTSVHTDSIPERLSGMTEMLRVTSVGERAIVVPFLGGMILRQRRWVELQHNKHNPLLTPHHVQELEYIYRREAAIDYALTDLVRTLMLDEIVAFTPVLTHEVTGNEPKDCISGIFNVQQTLTKSKAKALIDQCAAQFS